MHPVMRPWLLALLFTVLGIAQGLAQDAYPSRLVKIVLPNAAGSTTDILARLVADQLSRKWGKPVIVENVPGGGMSIGSTQVFRAAPDGYTLILSPPSPMTIMKLLYRDLPFEPSQFTPIALLVRVPNALVVRKDLPAANVKELIDYAKAHPGLNFGSVGIGSSQHLSGEYFSQITGVTLTHVPYRNIAQYGPDLIAGSVPLGFQWYPNIAGPLQAKGAIPLAVAGDKRLPTLPDTPTTTEAGLPQYKVNGWFALLAPAGTPRPILERLNKELMAALNDPQVKQGFEKAGAEVMMLSLDDSKKFLHDEIIKYRDIITKAGIEKIE